MCVCETERGIMRKSHEQTMKFLALKLILNSFVPQKIRDNVYQYFPEYGEKQNLEREF